jgi:hypothetical protein
MPGVVWMTWGSPSLCLSLAIVTRTTLVNGSAFSSHTCASSFSAVRRLPPKPFHFPELVLRVRALARRKSKAHSRTLRAAGVELDPLTGIVTRDGHPINLRVKERGVLEALLKASPGGPPPQS